MPTEVIIEPVVEKLTKEEAQIMVDKRFPADEGWKCAYLFGTCWRVNQWVQNGWAYKMTNSHFVTVQKDGIHLD